MTVRKYHQKPKILKVRNCGNNYFNVVWNLVSIQFDSSALYFSKKVLCLQYTEKGAGLFPSHTLR